MRDTGADSCGGWKMAPAAESRGVRCYCTDRIQTVLRAMRGFHTCKRTGTDSTLNTVLASGLDWCRLLLLSLLQRIVLDRSRIHTGTAEGCRRSAAVKDTQAETPQHNEHTVSPCQYSTLLVTPAGAWATVVVVVDQCRYGNVRK